MNEKRILILNDQGGAVMDISYDVTATLRAQDHGHPPVVLVFEPRSQDGVPRLYENEICPTLNTAQGGAKTAMCFNQTRFGEYEQAEQAVTLRSSGGDYGGGVLRFW